MSVSRKLSLALLVAGAVAAPAPAAPGTPEFHKSIRPILEEYCFDCHADGVNKGKVAFDEFKSDADLVANRDLWLRVLKNLRAGLMPPQNKAQPSSAEKELVAQWIKRVAFDLDPLNPDPGRVTLRRLNRVEYHNAIRDLLGVDFDAVGIFPPDDTGHGFDDIGDVLTLPPMLLEKYISAANEIIARAMPKPSSMEYRKFFPKPIPAAAAGRRAYARELLGDFARRAFRRPPDERSLNRLVDLAEAICQEPGKNFEAGIAGGMTAVLSSPRFLFLEGRAEPGGGVKYPFLDEFSLASRLSYFLWSSMPDDELMRLAEKHELRKNLPAQVDRMLKDKRSEALIEDFAGQWLRARDIETIALAPREILAREKTLDENARDGIPQDLSYDLRHAMRRETEMTFEYVLRQDRSLLELLDSDYTFLNGRLAEHYGITGVSGDEMRLVKLPADCPRGGVMTEGTVLGVTSNPTRTSPVKRGLFILDNLLGSPPPPPPPNVPPLEAASVHSTNRVPTLRETLAAHRENPLCSSCHNRMDPIGLALENFNALGQWRDQEFNEPIDGSGRLLTGESFAGIKELKQILAEKHAADFYRALTEKMLIYALGRGLEFYDTETTDEIVTRIETANGRSSALIAGIIESAPFQRTRRLEATETDKPKIGHLRADARMMP
ncbi:MAG: DUF1592 domain-containing protein [Verrucomicrobiota bacterium]|jgi:hypothetical protein